MRNIRGWRQEVKTWHDQIPHKENQEEGEDDAEEAGDVARPLKEGKQDEEKQREELNCETHSVNIGRYQK